MSHQFRRLPLLGAALLSPVIAYAEPVTLYNAKEIITMNDAQPQADAVAVQDGRILAVGSVTDLTQRYQDSDGFRLDSRFADQVITPGFVEPHLHAWLMGMLSAMEFVTPADWNLPWDHVQGVQNEADFLARVKQLDQSMPAGEPLWVWGYHQYFHGQNLSRTLLNGISSERPIVVWHRSFHEIFFNDAALELMGWTEQDWQGEAYAYNHLDWEKGHAYEQGGTIILGDVIGQLSRSGMIAKGFQRSAEYLQSTGITTAVDPGVAVDDATIRAMVQIFEGGDFPMDYWMIPSGFTLGAMAGDDPEKTLALAREQASNPDTQGQQIRWLPKHIKLFADGAMYSQLMQMKDGYTDGHSGEWMMYPDQLEATWRSFWQADYTTIVHANGDLGFDVAVGILEKLNQEQPRDDHRTDYHHLGFTDPADIDRAVKAGASFSVNPYYTHVLAEKYSEIGVGPERASQMARARSFLDKGGRLSLHSDAPMAPASPLALVWAAVNRQGLSGRVVGEQERITPQQAMRAVTLDAAYTARLEDEIGSIEPGKLANFAVLDQSPYQVEPQEIRNIQVMGTVYRGEVYASETGAITGLSTEPKSQGINALLHRIDLAHGRGDACSMAMQLQQSIQLAQHF